MIETIQSKKHGHGHGMGTTLTHDTTIP